MINLIPIEEKRALKKDFYYRFLIVFLTVFVFLIILSLLAISPSFIVSYEKRGLMNNQLEIQKNEKIPELDQKALAEIKNLNTRLGLLEQARKNKFFFSKNVIDEILFKKVQGIKINRISFENSMLDGKQIYIEGLAENREQLLLFRKALENDSLFKNVDLPISNFVKGQNIQFNLNLISS